MCVIYIVIVSAFGIFAWMVPRLNLAPPKKRNFMWLRNFSLHGFRYAVFAKNSMSELRSVYGPKLVQGTILDYPQVQTDSHFFVVPRLFFDKIKQFGQISKKTFKSVHKMECINFYGVFVASCGLTICLNSSLCQNFDTFGTKKGPLFTVSGPNDSELGGRYIQTRPCLTIKSLNFNFFAVFVAVLSLKLLEINGVNHAGNRFEIEQC